MSDSGVYLPSASSTESCDTLYSSNSSALRRRTACIKRKFRRRLIKTIQFSPAVFRSRLEQKFSVTEYLLCCVCVLFSMAKFMLRISSIWWHFIPSHYVRRRFSSVSALEFRCCREIPLVNQELTFYERISCIRRHDGFSLRSYRAVSLQVAPFARDCKDRGYGRDRRAGQTERKTIEFIVIWFKLISNRVFNREKRLYLKCNIAIRPIPLKGNNSHQYCK